MNTATSSYAELNTILDQARNSPHHAFTLTDQQLLGLQRRWCTALSARLDSAIEFAGARPLHEAVAAAWHELATEQATLRSLLDAGEHTCSALVAALRIEHRMLAHTAGLAGLDDPTQDTERLGRTYRQHVRGQEWSATPDRVA